jgi:hypothetical protein
MRTCLCPNTSTPAPQLAHSSEGISLLLRRIMGDVETEEEALSAQNNEVWGSIENTRVAIYPSLLIFPSSMLFVPQLSGMKQSNDQRGISSNGHLGERIG